MKRIGFVVACGLFFVACGDASPPTDPPTDPASDPDAPPSVPPASGRIASTDVAADAPTVLYADHEAAPPVGRPTAPADAARWHLGRFASYYRLSPAQVTDLELLELHDTGRGAIIARFARRIDGIEVIGERLSVAMERDLDVVALTGYVTGDVPGAIKLGVPTADLFRVDATRAVTSAMSDLSGIRLDLADFETPTTLPGGYRGLRLAPAGRARAFATSTEPARGKPVFFRQGPGSIVPAYYVEADLGDDVLTGAPRMFSYVIAGDDGRVLAKHDLTTLDHPVTYRVYADSSGLFTPWDGPQGTDATPHPTGIPDGFQPTMDPSQLVTLSSLTAVDVTDQWLPPGATETLGNNVDAYLDLAAPDGFTAGSADFRGTPSSADTFDYAFDTTLDANANVNQRQAAVTQLFYNINWFHDWYYAAGFTEAAGNAQFSNYGRGGLENDGIRGEAQDSGGFNNANMSTPADGNRPRMQMYLWTKPTQLDVTVTAPASLAGVFTTLGTASFGPLSFTAAGEIVRADPFDACTPLIGDYTGKIVFVDRGGIAACNGFAGKAQRVQAAGGTAIIIANVASSPNPTIPPGMGGTPTAPVTIGVLSMNLADGDRFRAEFTAGNPVTGSLVRNVQLLDGDIDNQIVAHEWGHYISNRLVHNSSGLQMNMARGLGEGWADFHALLITARAEDTLVPGNATWNGVYGMGAYATSTDPNSYYYGIRRYPYSTDMTKNPVTFKHISDANPLPASPPPKFTGTPSQVHNTGEIWASMLWESYAGLLRDTLGPTPRLTFAQARDRMRDYLVAAYKLTPANPTLLEARDAVLLAALLGDVADYNVIGTAFAKRGAGVYAVAPPRGENTNTPVVESFAWGAAVEQTGATLTDNPGGTCATDGILDNGETATLRVTFRNNGNTDTPAIDTTVSSTTAGITFPSGTTLSVPAMPRAGTATATILVAAAGLPGNTTIAVTVETPDAGAGGASPVTYSFAGHADELAGSSDTDTVERNGPVWTMTSTDLDPSPEVRWQRVETSPTNHAYRARSPSSATTSELQSPFLAVPAAGTPVLTWSSRFSFERDSVNNLSFDGGVIEVSTDGGVTWVDVSTLGAITYNGVLAAGNPLATRPAFVGTSAGYPAFASRSVNLGATLAGKVFLLRFRVSGDSSVSSPGWEIDDIQITGLTAPPFTGLIAQSATCNHQPIANAGTNVTVSEFGPAPIYTPTTVTLNGSASIDPDGNPLTYAWTQILGPTVTLSDPAARFPTFVAPTVTRLEGFVAVSFQLVVSDGTVASAAKQVTVIVNNTNRPPVANAGPPQTVLTGAIVTLDGTGSFDPDADDVITYLWTPPAGITLSSTTVAQPTFVAPAVTVSTDYTFTLVVSDGLANSGAQVVITVNPLNGGVTWQNVVGVTATGNDLVKTGGAGWNAGASTVETLTGDGYAEFGTGETTTQKQLGLSNGDASRSYLEIDFGMFLTAAGKITIRENGVNLGQVGSYVVGDRFRIQVTGNVVTYLKNGTLLFTSSQAPVFPLLVDTSLNTPGATLTDVLLVRQAVVWQNAVGVSVSGNSLTKTDPSNTFNAGASSTELIYGDGYVQFTTAEANLVKVVGLSNGDATTDFTEIDYGMFLQANGQIGVRENGVNRGVVGAYVAGDALRVVVSAGVVTYTKNGSLLYTSTVTPPTFPLRVDTSLRNPGATVNNVVLVGL